MTDLAIESERGERTLAPRLLAAVLLAGAVLAAHLSGLWGELVYDDLWLVETNPTIRSLGRLPAALSSALWDFLDPHQASHIGYWRPLAVVALFVGQALGGGAPWGFHAVSLALHVGAVLAAWRFARRLLRSEIGAFLAALFFGLHPVQVESVAWISAVNTPLAGLLSILALDAWLAWRDAGSRGRPLRAATFFLLALFSKETSAALVAMFVALDVGLVRAGRVRAPARELARAYVPVAAAGALWYALRAAVFASPWAGFDRVTTFLNVDVLRAATLRLELLGGFLRLSCWPRDLNAFRDVRPEVAFGDPSIWIGLGWVLAAAALGVVLWRRRAGIALAALLLLVAGLTPMLWRVESLGRFLLSDRFLYLPVLGACLLAAMVVARLRPTATVAAVGLGLAALLGVGSHARTAVWHDELALFETSARQSPDSPYVLWGLGRVHVGLFQQTGDPVHLDRALELSERVIELHDRARAGDGSIYASADDFLQTNLLQGWSYLLEAANEPAAQFEISEAIFRSTLEKFPDSEGGHTGLGVSLWKQGRHDEARAELELALAVNPKYWEAWWNLGWMELELGRWAEAERAFRETLAWRPRDATALAGLAAARANAGDPGEARELLQRALAVAPDLPAVHVQLGDLAAGQERLTGALGHFDDALEVDPRHAEAWLKRGLVQVALGRPDPALDSLRRACEYDPASFEAHYNLAALLVQTGRPQPAIPLYEHVLTLNPEPALADAIRAEIERLRAL